MAKSDSWTLLINYTYRVKVIACSGDTGFSNIFFSRAHFAQWFKLETEQMLSTIQDISGIRPVIVTVFFPS